MTEDASGSAGARAGGPSTWRGRNGVLVLIGLLLAAIVGGIAGGLIVRATWGSGNGSSAAAAPASNGTAAACAAAKVADGALASVVTVRATGRQAGGTGSGVVIRPGGYILTNNHVISVAAGGGTLSILRSDGEAADATIVGRDPLTDLAVIKTKASGLRAISFGKSDSLRVGQPVVALGSPLGLTSTVTAGIVSALNRYVRVPGENGQTAHLVGAIQTDASINPGNSGGALLDCQARLVGINTAGAAVSNTSGGSIGLGFAIPIDLASGIADELIANGRVTRPGFGMQVQQIPQELAQANGGSAGLFVQAVTSGGPADKAGLRPGDVIVKVDGEPAESVDALIVTTLKMQAGDIVRLTYERAGASHTTSLRLSSG